MQEGNNLGPYDDEETRTFYSILPDVHALVPSILLSRGQESDAKEAEAPLDTPSSADAKAMLEGGDVAEDAGEAYLKFPALYPASGCLTSRA